MGYNTATQAPSTTPVRTSIASWLETFKEQNIETAHDQSMLTLATPDDSLVVVGPARLSGDASEFYTVGMMSNFNYQEASQVSPMKAIGSRRHIFARSNAPVSGSIGRMVFLGANLYRALYALTNLTSKFTDRNSKFSGDGNGTSASWYGNMEEDIFRIPFGLGVIYNSAATLANGDAAGVGAEYLELCVLQSRSIGFQAGGSMIMEQVSFVADRVIPWVTYAGPGFTASSFDNPLGTILA